jgi:biopolymer transport protein ExbD
MNLRPRKAEPPRIDLTPLIDVVFLMLIFFMVSTTFDKQTQLKVDLPEAAPQTEQAESEDVTIEITIDPKGQFYVNERELVQHDAETLRRTLRKLSEDRADVPVIVSGDRNAPLQSMMTVLDVAGQLGLTRIRFVARHADAEG